MKIGILTTGQYRDDERLVKVANEKGHSASLIFLCDVSIQLSTGVASIYYKNKDITYQFDAIIPRINVSFTNYGIYILQQFICAQVYVSEQPKALLLGRDKLKCLQYLMKCDLPFPTTGIAYTLESFSSISANFKLPLIVKLIESTEGTGVFLAKSEKEVINIIKTYGRPGSSFIVQEFIEESAGKDVRVIVVNNKIVAVMKRESQDDDFRANVSLGAHSYPELLSQDEENMVLKATASIGINVAGVDFVRSRRGPLLLEINVSPDFTGEHGIESVTHIDVANSIIENTVDNAYEYLQEVSEEHLNLGLKRYSSL